MKLIMEVEFKLITKDPTLRKNKAVKKWLRECELKIQEELKIKAPDGFVFKVSRK